VARELEIGEYIILGKGTQLKRVSKNSILASTFEAVLGAVYIDGGYLPGRQIVKDFFKRIIALET